MSDIVCQPEEPSDVYNARWHLENFRRQQQEVSQRRINLRRSIASMSVDVEECDAQLAIIAQRIEEAKEFLARVLARHDKEE